MMLTFFEGHENNVKLRNSQNNALPYRGRWSVFFVKTYYSRPKGGGVGLAFGSTVIKTSELDLA